ncbi:MAG: hypothetical protein ACLFN2_06140 [Bacteroidales bacterium]
MNVYYHTSEAKGRIRNPVVTTGSFDGVHSGHQLIIDRLNDSARKIGGESVLITFYPHPRKVLYPEQSELKVISSQEEKIALLRRTGLDNLIIMPFTIQFSKTSPHEFVTKYLIEELGARVIVFGHNHHFGHERKGDYSYLHELSRKMDFMVEEIPLKLIEDETVSSAKIRKALGRGEVQKANAYLNHQYSIRGLFEKGRFIKALSDQPSISVDFDKSEKLIPPPGIYATKLMADHQCMKSMTLISVKDDEKPAVESLPIEAHYNPAGEKGILLFYKQVYAGNIENPDPGEEKRLKNARTEVEDLIY